MGLVVSLNVIVDVIEESGDIGNTVVDLSLLSVDLYKHGHIAAAQVQIKFRNLTVLKVFQYFGILDELLGGRLGKQSRSQPAGTPAKVPDRFQVLLSKAFLLPNVFTPLPCGRS